MNRTIPTGHRHYLLVLLDEQQEGTRRIEFEAPGPECALFRAEKECRGREAELFEDGRSLGRIKCATSGGYWVLTPAALIKPPVVPAPAVPPSAGTMPASPAPGEGRAH